MTIGRPKLTEGTKTAMVVAFVASCGERGANRAEIAARLGIPSKRACNYIQFSLGHGVIKAGQDNLHRFFMNQTHADAYAATVPALIAERRLAAKKRSAEQKAAYLLRKKTGAADYVPRAERVAKVRRVADAVIAAGQKGLSRKEADAAAGYPANCSDALSSGCQRGLIYAGGPVMFRRYFATKEWAQDWDIKGKEVRDAQVKENARARSRRSEQAKRERDAAYREAKRKERAKDTSRRKNAFVIVAGRDVPVKVHAPTRADLKAAQIVIPPHVKVQRCAPWTHDIRYQVGPGEPFHGAGLTAEWNERRRAA